MLMINNMVDIRIKSLKDTSFDELFEAFRQAFAEYGDAIESCGVTGHAETTRF